VRLPDSTYDPSDPFGELRALARQAGAQVVAELEQKRERPEPGSYIGRGKLDELKGLCEATDATTIIFDHDLSPRQIANIEEATERKVVDRSELILDIFASRATTHQAKLQVELAQLEYTYPRLRAMWSHLERIVGGSPQGIGTRGPGEQQIEIDRRLVRRRLTDLRRELSTIQDRKRREVGSRNEDHFTVGLVGYTNAGKSTLFNTLTAGGAYADDRVFATLMTRTREWPLGGGVDVQLSDTVGFVRDLPHNLIASFKATLEEATHADLLLIVLDVSDPAAGLQYETVRRTLDELFEEVGAAEARSGQPWTPPERILLLNKIDQLRDNTEVLVWQQRSPGAIPICALRPPAGESAEPGEEPPGQRELRERVRQIAVGPIEELTLSLPLSEGRTIHRLETVGEVLDREYNGQEVRLRVRLGRRQLDRLRARGAQLRVETATPA